MRGVAACLAVLVAGGCSAGEIVGPGQGGPVASVRPGAYVPLRGPAPVSKTSFSPGRGTLPIYLNRGGASYAAGRDDASANTSSVVASTGRSSIGVRGFGGDDAAWTALVGCVQGQFDRWNVSVTDVEPTSGPYIEVAFAGDGSELGLADYAGVAPIDADACGLIDRAVVFVFADNVGAGAPLCDAVAQEVGHAASLDHAYLCDDAMSYLDGCGAKRFQDVDASCGGYDARACICGRERQNSVSVLNAAIGARGVPGPGPGPSCGSATYAGTCDANGVLTWCDAGELRTLDCKAHGMDCGVVSDTVGSDCVEAAAPDACMGVTYAGECQGDTLRYCYGGAIQTIDCAASGGHCGYQDAATGYNCLLQAPPADMCGGVTYEGQCNGNVLEYCYNGAIETTDCTAQGQTCGYQDAQTGYNCLG
jgi:hypothetical protein